MFITLTELFAHYHWPRTVEANKSATAFHFPAHLAAQFQPHEEPSKR